MIYEFFIVTFVYMFLINFIIKKVGGAELKEIEKDVKKYLASARKGDEQALKKLNQLNARRMKLSMKANMYLFPITIPAIFFIKWRYAEITMTLFGREFGWFGLFLLAGIPFSIVSDKIVKAILKYD